MIKTIDEVIKQTKEKAEEQRERIITVLDDGREIYDPDCEKCAEEYEQLAEWLEELKRYRECQAVQDECDCCGGCKNSKDSWGWDKEDETN